MAQPLLAPDPDPFYAAPADIADHKPGDVLGVRAMPALGSFPDTEIRLIKFRSTDSEGKPIAATTTVLSPRNRRPDAPLLSLQQIINGLGAQCAVSRVLYTTDPNLTVREAPAWNVLLQRGWTVALPDHLGPRFAYGAAKLGGQITLDGIRARTARVRFEGRAQSGRHGRLLGWRDGHRLGGGAGRHLRPGSADRGRGHGRRADEPGLHARNPGPEPASRLRAGARGGAGART
ncbi:hypothetical protein GCM10010198_04150 [Nocardia seriolae]